MKALKLFIIVTALLLAATTKAQVSVNVNIGSPPMWGPAGYSDVQYYYLPDVYSYYDVRSSMFIYQSGGVWVHRTYLPTRYRNYDLYNGYKAVMTDYHGNKPYDHYKDYKRRYVRGYHGPAQRNIGERPGNGYSGTKGHSARQYKESGHGNVKSNSQRNDRSKGHGNSKKNNGGHDNGNRKK